jgi:hypothetical protein
MIRNLPIERVTTSSSWHGGGVALASGAGGDSIENQTVLMVVGECRDVHNAELAGLGITSEALDPHNPARGTRFDRCSRDGGKKIPRSTAETEPTPGYGCDRHAPAPAPVVRAPSPRRASNRGWPSQHGNSIPLEVGVFPQLRH